MSNANRPDSWHHLATQPSIVKRACAYAVIVGALLIAINHGDAILHGDVTGTRLLKMGLTVLVPYAVSTLSSVGALRAPRIDRD
ncbi:MAG: nitrate/nitrite transporter NrtS [Phycisphaerae bacterium]